MEPKPCPYCKSAEVFYGEYDTLSETTFGGYKIRCKCGYAYRKSVWCDSANGAVEAWNRRADEVSRNERKKTNADRIRSMTDEELAEFIRSMVDGSYNYDFACYKYTNYVTHHSDPANKGIYLCKCDDCESEGIGLDVLMWLQRPAEGE